MAENGKVYFDLLGPFPDGMNSGVQPLLLPKTQLAFATNATVRGAYIHDRPPYQIRNLDFGASGSLQTEVENGFFQGTGVYRPDYGPSQIIAQISGRLYSFTETGTVFVVQDITIPGDANDATTSQVWMWQAEKWLIISDGSGKLPIFYDGVSCRRSYGPSRLLAIATAYSTPTPPAIGSSMVATLTAPYNGPWNTPVRFNGAIYELQPTAGGGNAILTNINDTPTATVPVGTQVIVNPGLVGYTTAAASCTYTLTGTSCIIPLFCTGYYRQEFVLSVTSVGSLVVGNQVSLTLTGGTPGTFAFNVTAVDPVGLTITCSRTVTTGVSHPSGYVTPPPPSLSTVASGSLVQLTVSPGPNVIIGTTVANYVVPSVGGSVGVTLDSAYTGADNQLVLVGTAAYTIAKTITVGSNQVVMLNVTDTSAAAYASPLDIFSIAELPACRMGAYGMGQNWVCLVDGIEFMVSDLVGSSSGTQTENYRDAVLKATDAEIMGNFRLPNAGFIINSMTFAAQLDTSLGQGALEIGTMVNMFSCKAPFTLQDFQATIVQPMQNPILTESLIGTGPLGQNSTVLANSDTMFRSTAGLGSLKIARRDISDEWGNTPISREMSRVIDRDNNSPLLTYSSAIVFDNRLRMTVSPVVATQGVYHEGEIALNFDLVSSLRGKAPPVYDGLWTGLNVLQHITGMFNTIQRSFAFTYNITLSKLELYELLSDPTLHKDNGVTPILWTFETPVIFNQDVKPLPEIVRLIDGEIYISDLQDTAHFKVQYRPVFYPCWIDWTEFDVCADMTKEHSEPQVTYPLGLGEPSAKDCDTINNRPFREAVGFQLRFEITGHCIFWGAKIAACSTPQPKWAKPACNR